MISFQKIWRFRGNALSLHSKMNLKQFKILIDSLYDKFGGDIQVFRKNGNSRENPVIAAEVVKGESRGISKKDSSILLIE